MYLTLNQAKKHLNIDDSYIDDDDYINDLISVAESSVELHIDQSLSGLTTSTLNASGETVTELPAPILHAMLLMIGGLYSIRENVSFTGKAIAIPYNYQYLLDFYQNYL